MSDDQQRLLEIKNRFTKLGWLKREDILWLLEVLEKLLSDGKTS